MADKNVIGNLEIEPSVTEGIEQMSRDLRDHIEEARKLGEISSRVSSMFVRMVGAYVTFEAVTKVIGDSVKRVAERERNILKLEAVLTAHNIKNREITRIYSDMAKEINNTTIHTTEAAMSAEGTLTALGVGPTLMHEALNATAQLATQTGSLDSAAMMLGQALAGNTRKIGNLVYTLKGVKNASPQKVFTEINLAFGKSAQAQIDGYMGQCARLKKEYEAFSHVIGKFLVPYLTKGLKYLNENKNGVMSRDPAVAVPAMINEWIFGEKQWTWSVGRQPSSKILEDADKQFTFSKIDNGLSKNTKSSIESMRDLWIKAQAEEYAAAEELNTKWFEDQRKAAIEANEAEMKANSEAWKADYDAMVELWKLKDQEYQIINKLEENVIRDQQRQIMESLDSIRALNPQSAGVNMAVSGLETIVNADTEKADTYKLFLDQAQKQYEQAARDWMAGTKSISDLELAQNDVLMAQFMDDKRAMFNIVKGNLMVFQGIATMLYELKQDTTWFYVVQAIEVQIAELSKIGAMWEAYQIGDKVGGYWAPYLKWVFMAIAAAIGDMHIMMILSKTPNSKSVGRS